MAEIATDKAIIEVEFDGPHNECCFFRPLKRRLRGRFDLHRDSEPMALTKLQKHPVPVPGQRIRLNTVTKEAELIEPLREPANRELLKRYSVDFEVGENEKFQGVDVYDWAYWLACEVRNGTARLLNGADVLPDPDAADQDKIKREIISKPRIDKATKALSDMAGALEKNTAVMEALLNRLSAPAGK